MYTKQIDDRDAIRQLRTYHQIMAGFTQAKAELWIPKTKEIFTEEVFTAITTNINNSKIGKLLQTLSVVRQELTLRHELRQAAIPQSTGRYHERPFSTLQMHAFLKKIGIEKYMPLLFEKADKEQIAYCKLRLSYASSSEEYIQKAVEQMVGVFYATHRTTEPVAEAQIQAEKTTLVNFIQLMQETDYTLRHRTLQASYTKLTQLIEKHIYSVGKVPKTISGFKLAPLMVMVFEQLKNNPAALLQIMPNRKENSLQVNTAAIKTMAETPLPLDFHQPAALPEAIMRDFQGQVLRAIAHFMEKPAAMTAQGCNLGVLFRGHEHDHLRDFVRRLPKLKETLLEPQVYSELYSLYMRYYGIVDAQGVYWGDIGEALFAQERQNIQVPEELQHLANPELQRMINLLYYAAEHFGTYQITAFWQARLYTLQYPEIKNPYLNGIALYRVHAAGAKGSAA